jgi:hypothetical protein
VPNKPNSPGPAAQNKPNSRSAGYPQDSTMLSFHHSSSIPIAPNEANFARRPRTRETETCKTNPIRLIKSAKRTQFLGARGRLCKAKPIARSGAPRRCPAGAGRGVPCGTRGCCTNKPNSVDQICETNPILASQRPIVQSEANCPKRGTEAVSRRGWARRALRDKGVLYKQTQFGVPSREEGCRCEQAKPNLGELGHLGADAEGLVQTNPIWRDARYGLPPRACVGRLYKQTQFGRRGRGRGPGRRKMRNKANSREERRDLGAGGTNKANSAGRSCDIASMPRFGKQSQFPPVGLILSVLPCSTTVPYAHWSWVSLRDYVWESTEIEGTGVRYGRDNRFHAQ